ncbi:MAG: PASTA domain-containing protein, partial [Cryobacterium sp.]
TLLELDLSAKRSVEASADVPRDEVIRTAPPTGTIVRPSESITVFISTGAQPTDVPNVTNQTLTDARASVRAAGLVPGSVTLQNSPTVTADVVIGTDPEAGSEEQVGYTVNFVVSSGSVRLPDMTGQPLSAASNLLSGDALQLGVLTLPDPECESQLGSPVTGQSGAPGDVPQGSEITLTYCSG